MAHRHAVYKQVDVVWVKSVYFCLIFKQIVNAQKLSVRPYTRIALLQIHLQLLSQRSSFDDM